MLFSHYIAQECLASFFCRSFCRFAGPFLSILPKEGYPAYGAAQMLAIPAALQAKYTDFLKNRMVPSNEHWS
jgi:hypothetical protein